MAQVNFDEDGFLLDPQQWDEALAKEIAFEDGVGELSPEHFAIIKTVREKNLTLGEIPCMRHVCRMNHLGDHCVGEMFSPGGLELWRIAGLANPGEEAKAYMWHC